eukprot:scaffold1415_cov152-Skeletonema_menzelii.AAC.2
MNTSTSSKKQVRFSRRSTMCVFNEPSLSQEQESNLWYSTEEIDLLKACHSHQVHEVRSQLEVHNALLNEEGFTISAAAILGLEKYLSPELTAEYKDRRLALHRAVLAEHRRHRVMRVPQSTARLAMTSAKHSQWARERARAAALFLEQDLMRDLKKMNPQAMVPRRCSMAHFNEADANEEVRKWPSYQRRWSVASSN